MEQDKLTLMAEEGTSLSSGSLRLYALPYGCVDLYAYDPVNRRAAVGIMVATEYRRQGYGLAILKELENMFSTPSPLRGTSPVPGGDPKGISCSPETGELPEGVRGGHPNPIHTLYADIAAVNTASLALVRKAGYTQCGHFKEWLEYDSHFIDNIRMQKIL